VQRLLNRFRCLCLISPRSNQSRNLGRIKRKQRPPLVAEQLEPRLAMAAATLPGDSLVGLAAGHQISPAIARGDNSLLAVWSDARANVTGSYEGETSQDLYGVRIDALGNVLDTVPLALVTKPATQDHPKVAWNGTNWLIVYESYDLSGTGYGFQKSLEAIRVSPAGKVLDDEPIKLIGLTPISAGFWNVASDGNNWVVVNEGTSASSDLVAVRIAPSGQRLDPPTRALVDGSFYARSNLQLAYANDTFLLTYYDPYAEGGFESTSLRFDRELHVLGAGSQGMNTGAITSLATNGTGYYALWNETLPNFSSAVFGSRIDTQGTLLDGNGLGINISLSHEAQTFESPIAVVWDGIDWKVTWTSAGVLRSARIDVLGNNHTPGGLPISTIRGGPSAGTGIGGVQFVWTNFANNNYDIFMSSVSSGGMATASRPLSVGSPSQLRPDMATNGNGTMLVYQSSTGLGTRILAQPLNVAGQPLSQEPLELQAATLGILGSPSVAWNGSCYLVVWPTPNGIVGQRLDPLGTKIDVAPRIMMASGFGSARIAAVGDDFLVTGLKVGIAPRFISPVAVRVRGADGVVLDPSPLALGASYVRSAPQVVSLDGRWLVTWHANVTHDSSIAYTRGAFVHVDGTLTPSFEIHGPFSTAGGNGSFEIGLASNGTDALLVQSQELSSGVETDLLAHVIHADGSVSPMIHLTPWSGNQYRPRAAWDGNHFVVTYQDQKNRAAPQAVDQLDARSDLFAMRITSEGAIVDPMGFLFSALPIGETDPSIVAGNGTTILAGSHMLNDGVNDNYRIVYEQFATTNQRPVAVARADATTGDIPFTVNFQSTGSIDLDGSLAGYAWDFGQGQTSNEANPSFTFTTAGHHLVQLTVSDLLGAESTQTIVVQASLPNELPIAIANADVYFGNAPLHVTFDADGSYDPDGFIGNLEWIFPGGSTNFGTSATHTFDAPGTYEVELRVSDARGGIGTATVQILVGGNQPGDFDGNGFLDGADVDSLSQEILSGRQTLYYDVNEDTTLDVNDLYHWVLNLKQTLLGDANLDFVVDGSDFGIWNSHKFTTTSAWTKGDFTADRAVDGSDFAIWNSNKFSSAVNRNGPNGFMENKLPAGGSRAAIEQSEIIDAIWADPRSAGSIRYTVPPSQSAMESSKPSASRPRPRILTRPASSSDILARIFHPPIGRIVYRDGLEAE
jgi:PKD repeat protein